MRKTSLVLLLFLSVIQVYSQWQWLYPQPQGNILRDFTFIDSGETGFAVGDFGTIMKSTDTGAGWDFIDDVTTTHLRSVYFFNEDLGYVTGDSGLIIRYDGAWTEMSTPTFYQLRDIDFFSESFGIAVGYKGLILKMSDGEWNEVSSGTLATLNAIAVIDEQKALAVGDEGKVLTTNDAGTTWSGVNSGTNDPLFDVFFPSADVGFIVGNQGLMLKSNDGGASWTDITSPFVEDDLYGIWFRDDQSGSICGANGTLVSTVNGGENWSLHYHNSGYTFFDVFARGLNPPDSGICDTVTVCGINGAIINDYRGDSCYMDAEFLSGNYGSLNSMLFHDTVAWAVGGDPFNNVPLILTSKDGLTWREDTVEGITEYVSDIAFANDTLGYMSGYNGMIYRTTDAGNNWVEAETDVTRRLTAIIASMVHDTIVWGWAVGFNGTIIRNIFDVDTIWEKVPSGTEKHLYDIAFYDAWNGYAVGQNGALLKITSTIGNYDITPIASGVNADLYDITYVTESLAFIVGFNGKIFKFNFADKNKALVPVPSGVTTQLNSVYFPQPNTGYIAGNGGLVLKSTDSGNSWLPLRTNTFNNLREVWFSNVNKGYVFGSGATILYTEDGGGPTIQPGIGDMAKVENVIDIYPNPTGGNFTISLDLQHADDVSAFLYELGGSPVKKIMDEKLPAGKHTRQVKANMLPQGIYILVVNSGQYRYTGKVVIMN